MKKMSTTYNPGTFISVPNIHKIAGIDPHAQVIFMWLIKFIDDKGMCFPSIKSIASLSGISERTVQKKMIILEELGILRKEIRKNTETGENYTNLYTIAICEPTNIEFERLNRYKKSNKSMGGCLNNTTERILDGEVGVQFSDELNTDKLNPPNLSKLCLEEESLSLNRESNLGGGTFPEKETEDEKEVVEPVDEDGFPIRNSVKIKNKTKSGGDVLRLANSYVSYRETIYKAETGQDLYRNKIAHNEAVKRNLKPASKLVQMEIPRSEVLACMKYCDENYEEWTLETVVKKIDEYKLNKKDA
jgi:hypothetical protein